MLALGELSRVRAGLEHRDHISDQALDDLVAHRGDERGGVPGPALDERTAVAVVLIAPRSLAQALDPGPAAR